MLKRVKRLFDLTDDSDLKGEGEHRESKVENHISL